MCVVLAALLCLAGPARARDTVCLTNGEWPPYLSEHLPHHGFASHVVSRAFELAGLQVEYGFYPWRRSYDYARDALNRDGKRWDGTIVWIYADDRAPLFHYSDPVVIDSSHLFHLKSHPIEWKHISDLKGKTMGGTLHTNYTVLEQAEKDGILRIERTSGYGSLLGRLMEQRVDAIPMVKQVGLYYIRTLLSEADQKRVDYSPKPFETRKYHLIVSKTLEDGEEVIRQFNLGLKKLKKSGEYARMLRDLEQGKYD